MIDKRQSGFPGSNRYRKSAVKSQPSDLIEELPPRDTVALDDADFRVEDEKSEMVARSERLRTAVRNAGGNTAVSSRARVPVSTLSDYLAGKDWRFSSAVSLARACKVSLDWLAGVEFAPSARPDGADITFVTAETTDTVQAKNYAIIPKYDVNAAAGAGNEIVDEDVSGSVAMEETFFRENLGVSSKSIVTIRAEGDSMDPTIRDGDLLFVDTSVQEVQNSRIYVLNVNDRLLVKRVQLRVDGSFVVKSDNPRYDPEIIVPSERAPLRIIGRVVYQAGPVRS